jgi:hypothetical protein
MNPDFVGQKGKRLMGFVTALRAYLHLPSISVSCPGHNDGCNEQRKPYQSLSHVELLF